MRRSETALDWPCPLMYPVEIKLAPPRSTTFVRSAANTTPARQVRLGREIARASREISRPCPVNRPTFLSCVGCNAGCATSTVSSRSFVFLWKYSTVPEIRLFIKLKSTAPSIWDVCSHLRSLLPLLDASTPPWATSPHGYAAPVLPASVISDVYGSTLGLPCRPQPSRSLRSLNGRPCANDSCERCHEAEMPGNAAHLWPWANREEPS